MSRRGREVKPPGRNAEAGADRTVPDENQSLSRDGNQRVRETMYSERDSRPVRAGDSGREARNLFPRST